jgi:hypothetical protein
MRLVLAVIVLLLVAAGVLRADMRATLLGGMIEMTTDDNEPMVTLHCRKPHDLVMRVVGPDGAILQEVWCDTDTNRKDEKT